MSGRFQVVFQTPRPRQLAEFWRTALGYVAEPPPDGYDSWESFAADHGLDLTSSDIDSAVDPAGVGPRLLFEFAEAPTRGDALHLDVNVSAPGGAPDQARQAIDEHSQRLKKLGARVTRVVDTTERYWVEMTDPDGNWFCIQ